MASRASKQVIAGFLRKYTYPGFEAQTERAIAQITGEPGKEGETTMPTLPTPRFDRYTFGNDPQGAFAPDGILAGYNPDSVDAYEYDALAALPLPLSDEETIGRLSDGRLAVVGLTVEGHPFLVEAEPFSVAAYLEATARETGSQLPWVPNTNA